LLGKNQNWTIYSGDCFMHPCVAQVVGETPIGR